MSKKTWIQIDGKLVPKEAHHHNLRHSTGVVIIPDIQPFKSPVDGRIVNSRSSLRVHNKELDVHSYADYSPDYIAQRQNERNARLHGQTKADKANRIEHIKQALERPRRT